METRGSALSLDEIFDFAPVFAHRRARVAAINEVLSVTEAVEAVNVPEDGMALRYAVAHHLIEGAERVARAADVSGLTWYRTRALQDVLSRSISGARGQYLIVAPATDAMLVSPVSETPYYILNQTGATATRALRALALDALLAGDRNGFGALLSNQAAVICLLAERRAGEYLNSWTISRLPGTVFLDYLPLPSIVARDLIHESGHNWLNDALSACKISLEGTGEFYSPWKRTMRPTFGFLHACWAFPLTVIFGTSAKPHTSGAESEILERYLTRQRALLRETRENHRHALATIPDQGLRDRLQRVYELAAAE